MLAGQERKKEKERQKEDGLAKGYVGKEKKQRYPGILNYYRRNSLVWKIYIGQEEEGMINKEKHIDIDRHHKLL